jgi:CheY-like chemotaxis protein
LPDLFILDKQLAGVDGLDVCRFLKNNETTRHIPVLMMSASPSIMSLASEYGCDGAIEKPFSIKRIKQEVADLLERASLHE